MKKRTEKKKKSKTLLTAEKHDLFPYATRQVRISESFTLMILWIKQSHREIQMDLASTRMANIQQADTNKFVEEVEKKEPTYVAGEYIKQFDNLLKSDT